MLENIIWPQIIRVLKAHGFSQYTLAERVGVDQSTICRLGDGRAPEPRYSVGRALISLAGGDEVLRLRYGICIPVQLPPAPVATETVAGVAHA